MTKKMALVVAQICATHQLAQDFNEELLAVANKRKAIVDMLTTEANRVAEQGTYEYSYAVVSASKEPFLPQAARDGDPVRVVRRWLNKDWWDDLNKKFGVDKTQGKREVDVSVVYYRVGDVVVSTGSGKPIVQANQRFSDEEWDDVKSSKIQRYLNHAA